MTNLTLLVLSYFVRVWVSEHLAQFQRDPRDLVRSELPPVFLPHGSKEVFHHCRKRSDQHPTNKQEKREGDVRLFVSSSMMDFGSSNFWRIL